jgi:hypothetical protein
MALDLLQGYSVLPRKSRLSKDWSDFRDVSHVIAASAAVAFAGREQTKQQQASAVLTPLLLVPEVVLALGLAFQKFGLAFEPHGQRTSILPSKTLWRIPAIIQFDPLPLPVRRLSDADLKFLTTVRCARPKRDRLATPLQLENGEVLCGSYRRHFVGFEGVEFP